MSVDMTAVVAPDGSIVFAHPDESKADAKMQERIAAGALEGEYQLKKFVARGVERENDGIDVRSGERLAGSKYSLAGKDDGSVRIMLRSPDGGFRTVGRGDMFAETRSGIPIVVRGYDDSSFVELVSGRNGLLSMGSKTLIRRLENGEWYHRGQAKHTDAAIFEAAEQADARPGTESNAVESVRRELRERKIS